MEYLGFSSHEERDVLNRGGEGTYSTQMTPQSEPFPPWTAIRTDQNKVFSPTPPPRQAVDPGSTFHMSGLNMLVTDAGQVYGSAVSAAPTMEMLPPPGRVSPAADVNTPGQQLKVKRIAPELVQKKPLHILPVPIATEADTLSNDSRNAYPWDTSDPSAYLGPGAISKGDVRSHLVALTVQIQGEGDALCTPAPTQFPPGRRLAINKIMRGVLVNNGKKIAMADAGIDTDAARQSSTEGDKILDLDDIPDDVDIETMREMEAEKAEQAQKSEPFDGIDTSKLLSEERVQTLLDEEVREMTNKWTQRKRPKYQNKANALWVDASKRGAKTNRILEARGQAKFYDGRIKKLERGILKQTWEKEKQVRFQARLLQQNVEDKLYQCWLAETLESRFPPPKPIALQTRSVKRSKPKVTELSDGEVLTSSDEEAFLVDDEEPVPPITSVKENRHAFSSEANRTPSPICAESPMYIDLTQMDSSPAATPVAWSTEAVDQENLDTPEKVQSKYSPIIKQDPNIDGSIGQMQVSSWAEKYQDIEKIIAFPISHWSKEKERFALTITLLWKLGQTRRSAVFEHVRGCEIQESFKATILSHISNPLRDLDHLSNTSPQSLAFDISRLFLCFLKTKNLKETRLADLKSSQIAKLKAKENHSSWIVFHSFLTQMAPLFPQDNQIFREEVTDDDELLGDDVGEDEVGLLEQTENSKTPRKAASKEIVRNKEAVDLREREVRRQEEQEARRLRLRANLGIDGQISSDKSRLIINESKQDDQPFIYIHDDIGRRIKDHQIDGVRFMWNQIIQDPALRQGCLLSHSMGLGKTMQVITLLVAIQDSSKSSDPGVVSQIPEDLRPSKTMVVCPAGLVNNWLDELMIWDKDLILGDIYVIESSFSPAERASTIQKWSQIGGVLVIGYPMLRKMADLMDDEQQSTRSIFEEANIVIADEAHQLKNPLSKVHLACSSFRTSSRIAMTGSPLANNIEEYYFMINWVAPNFLGPVEEFREIYSNPIQHGVDVGSSGEHKRKALRRLAALKQIVAPKVHRATIKTLMRGESVGDIQGETALQGAIFRIINDLGLLCNHPFAFYEKANESQELPKTKHKPRASLPASIIPAVLAECAGIDMRFPFLSTKVELLIQILDDARKNQDKVLLFSQSLPTLDYLSTLFQEQKRRFSRLDGSTPISKRQDEIKKFNANETEVYLISTKAGGVGLNIQGASKVVIFDFGWNPMHEQQAIGRSYRIGQTKPVSVYHFVTAGTFEQDLHGKTIFKTQLATRVVDKKNPIKNDVICKIMSTDTFEEEDIKAPLSAEEQKEVNDMAALNSLRMKDPEEYRRRQRELEERQFLPNVSYSVQDASSSRDDETVFQVQRALNGATDDPMLSTPRSQTKMQSQTPVATTALGSTTEIDILVPSRIVPESKATSVSASILMPILGAHTYFGKDATQTSEEKTLGESDQNSFASKSPPSSTLKHPGNPFTSQIKNTGKAEFKKRFCRKLEVFPEASLSYLDAPRLEIVDKVIDSIDAIRREHKFGFLPDNRHWQELSNFIEEDNFVFGVMSGQFRASYLALADAQDLAKNISKLGNPSSADLGPQVQVGEADDGSGTQLLSRIERLE
ncbi:hypothetical protein ED733_004387 [Metarhizium rileyi]|uniref:SNF2-related protein n=1 Tax=Metarhizium rileyi (strain RCEF 4871) TaxID=1649241 RepID=A0A5C6GAI5_METRR|nr:hypothetical protein ED733_004387 [Metarhizium rileyi]